MNWIACPHCDLKYSERADGMCPRCHRHFADPPTLPADAAPEASAALATAAPPASPPVPQAPARAPSPSGAPPASAARPTSAGRLASQGPRLGPKEGSDAEVITTGARAAGVIMIAVAALAYYTQVVLQENGRLALLLLVGPATISLFFGGMLVYGSVRFVSYARGWTSLSILLFSGPYLVMGVWLPAAVNMVYHVSLLALLTPRLPPAGMVLSSLVALGTATGSIIYGLGGVDGMAAKVRARRYAAESDALAVRHLPLGHCDGIIQVPPGKDRDGNLIGTTPWRLRRNGLARADNAQAELWLVQPDLEAHVVVLSDPVIGSPMTLGAYHDQVLSQLVSKYEEFAVRTDELSDGSRARIVEGGAKVAGVELEHYHKLMVSPACGVHVFAFAPKETYARARESLVFIANSAYLNIPAPVVPAQPPPPPPHAPPAPPADGRRRSPPRPW